MSEPEENAVRAMAAYRLHSSNTAVTDGQTTGLALYRFRKFVVFRVFSRPLCEPTHRSRDCRREYTHGNDSGAMFYPTVAAAIKGPPVIMRVRLRRFLIAVLGPREQARPGELWIVVDCS